ncbi:pRiA4b ORF-3-like protein [Alkalibaculum bacchi]|uniref:PRiA4b ORF-3-like protein n=1 Tax=Alkalibaculum bacchi TaxID=645887 RepID=A0A366I2R6_9FIRM|nr:plasmid pRiA4b ORF-3 family protein [Alkalibaculum bacchi]RBP61049.1 pRiA4b ORF-3-like protein [Alkalibaculum bacchi]
MKSYIIKIELEESNPLIWRRVVMPAGATYKRLHDAIQNATNFLGGYPSDGYHLYEFDLAEQKKIVTDNDEAYLEHHHYKRNKKIYDKRLKAASPDMLEFEKRYQERLKIQVCKPTGLKIDDYLEKHNIIRYNYDFGDGWHFIVKLEEIVDDYYFGFPTLLDGAETAPPEDVGGIDGFYEFMKVYYDKEHPEHEDTKLWAKSLGFIEYDPDIINTRLKWINYKKTEWDKINHKNYQIVENKYRKR